MRVICHAPERCPGLPERARRGIPFLFLFRIPETDKFAGLCTARCVCRLINVAACNLFWLTHGFPALFRCTYDDGRETRCCPRGGNVFVPSAVL